MGLVDVETRISWTIVAIGAIMIVMGAWIGSDLPYPYGVITASILGVMGLLVSLKFARTVKSYAATGRGNGSTSTSIKLSQAAQGTGKGSTSVSVIVSPPPKDDRETDGS